MMQAESGFHTGATLDTLPETGEPIGGLWMSDELEAIEETAKAAQEIAKFGSKVVDAAQNAAPFINRVFGRPIEDATGSPSRCPKSCRQ
jgi:hypothetical protein